MNAVVDNPNRSRLANRLDRISLQFWEKSLVVTLVCLAIVASVTIFAMGMAAFS